jgi:hypothetical protein
MQTTCLDSNLNCTPSTSLTEALKANGLISTEFTIRGKQTSLQYNGITVGQFKEAEVVSNSSNSNSIIITLDKGYLLTPVVLDFKDRNFTLITNGLILKDFNILDFDLLEGTHKIDNLSKRLVCLSLRGMWQGC